MILGTEILVKNGRYIRMSGIMFTPGTMPRAVIERRTGHSSHPEIIQKVIDPFIIGSCLKDITPGRSAGIFQIGSQTAFLPLNDIIHIGQGELSLGDRRLSIVIENTRCSASIRTGKMPGDISISNDKEDLPIEITRDRKQLLVSHDPLHPTALKPGDVLSLPLEPVGSEKPGFLKVIFAIKEAELAHPQLAEEAMLAREPQPPIEQVSMDRALVKLDLSKSTAIDAKLVEGTVFAEVKTISDLFTTYKNTLKFIEKKGKDVSWKAFLTIGAPLGSICAGLGGLFLSPINGVMGVILGAILGVAGVCFMSEAIGREEKKLHRDKIISELSIILKGLSSEEISKSLKRTNDPSSTDQIITLLEKIDLAKALAIRQFLDQKL